MTVHRQRKTAITHLHELYRPGKRGEPWDNVFVMVYRGPRGVERGRGGKKHVAYADEQAFTTTNRRSHLISLAYVHKGKAYAIDQHDHLEAYIHACVEYRVELEEKLARMAGSRPNPDHRFALLWRMGQAMEPSLRGGKRSLRGPVGRDHRNRWVFDGSPKKLSFPEWFKDKFKKDLDEKQGGLRRLGLPKSRHGYSVQIDSALPYALAQANHAAARLPEHYPFMSFRRGYLRALNEQGRAPLEGSSYKEWLLSFRTPVYAYNSYDQDEQRGLPLEGPQPLQVKERRVILKPLGFTLFPDLLKSLALAALYLESYRASTRELMRSYGYLKEVSRVVSYAEIPEHDPGPAASKEEREDWKWAKGIKDLARKKCVDRARLEIKQSMSRGGSGAAYRRFNRYLSSFYDDWIKSRKLQMRCAGFWHIGGWSLGPYFVLGYAFRMAKAANKKTQKKFNDWTKTALQGGKVGASASVTYRLPEGETTFRAEGADLSRFVPIASHGKAGEELGLNAFLVKGIRGIELPEKVKEKTAKESAHWKATCFFLWSEHGLIYHCLWFLNEAVNTAGTHLLDTLDKPGLKRMVRTAYRTMFNELSLIHAAETNPLIKDAIRGLRSELRQAKKATVSAAKRYRRFQKDLTHKRVYPRDPYAPVWSKPSRNAAKVYRRRKWMKIKFSTGPAKWANSVDDFYAALHDFQKIANDPRIPARARRSAADAIGAINDAMMDPKTKLGAFSGKATNVGAVFVLLWSFSVVGQAFAPVPGRLRKLRTAESARPFIDAGRDILAGMAAVGYFAGDFMSAFPNAGKLFRIATVQRIERGVRVSLDGSKLKEAFTLSEDKMMSSSKGVGSSVKAVRFASLLQVAVAAIDVGLHEYDVYQRSKHHPKLSRDDYHKRVGGGLILVGSIISAVGVFCEPIGLVLNVVGIGLMAVGNLYNYWYIKGDDRYENQNYLRRIVAISRISAGGHKGRPFRGIKNRRLVDKLVAAIEDKGKADEHKALYRFIPLGTFVSRPKVRLVWLHDPHILTKYKPTRRARGWDKARKVMVGDQLAYNIETFNLKVGEKVAVRFVNRSDLSKWWDKDSSTLKWWTHKASLRDEEITFKTERPGHHQRGVFDTTHLLTSDGALTRRLPLALTYVPSGAVSNDNKTYRYCGPYVHLPTDLHGVSRHAWFYRSKRGRLRKIPGSGRSRARYGGSLRGVDKLYLGLDLYGPVAEAAGWKTPSWEMTSLVCGFHSICWTDKGGARHEASKELRFSRPSEEVTSGRYRGYRLFELDASTLEALLGNMASKGAPSSTLTCELIKLEFAFERYTSRPRSRGTVRLVPAAKAFIYR